MLTCVRFYCEHMFVFLLPNSNQIYSDSEYSDSEESDSEENDNDLNDLEEDNFKVLSDFLKLEIEKLFKKVLSLAKMKCCWLC